MFFYRASILRFRLSVYAFSYIFIDSSLALMLSTSDFYLRLLRLPWLLSSLTSSSSS